MQNKAYILGFDEGQYQNLGFGDLDGLCGMSNLSCLDGTGILGHWVIWVILVEVVCLV